MVVLGGGGVLVSETPLQAPRLCLQRSVCRFPAKRDQPNIERTFTLKSRPEYVRVCLIYTIVARKGRGKSASTLPQQVAVSYRKSAAYLKTHRHSKELWDPVGKEFQFEDFLALKFTTQHDLYS